MNARKLAAWLFTSVIILILALSNPLFKAGQTQVLANVYQQDTLTPYPQPSPDTGATLTQLAYPYPQPGLPTNTLAGLPTQATRTASALTQSVTLTATQTATSQETLTPGLNLYETENAEIASARISPPPTESPAPSATRTALPTPTSTPTPTEGFQLDTSWFAGGLILSALFLLALWFANRLRASGEFK